MTILKRVFQGARNVVYVIGACVIAFLIANALLAPADYVQGHVSVRRLAPTGADHYGTLILVDQDGNPNSVHVDEATYRVAQLGRWVKVKK